jgi:solute carrier family 8 (sodium/calcium exchanger)
MEYTWGETKFKSFIRFKGAQGFVDEYYDDELCHSPLILIPGTSLLSKGFLAVVYFIFLCWLFMGIAIIADIFMEAIEVITSKTVIVEVWDEEGRDKYPIEVPVWNATLANLSLMALGSSAPEIFLSVIDTVRGLG